MVEFGVLGVHWCRKRLLLEKRQRLKHTPCQGNTPLRRVSRYERDTQAPAGKNNKQREPLGRELIMITATNIP